MRRGNVREEEKVGYVKEVREGKYWKVGIERGGVLG